jgi:peptidoglycan/xylan/chitin deacetylase (PgdA/CDA1 family)
MASDITRSLRSTAIRSVKQFVIRTGLEAIALSGAGRFAPASAGRGVILTLHHVRPERNHAFEPNGHLSVTPEFLDQALSAAREAGLHPVHLEQLPSLLSDPTDSRKFVCLTLDDGYRDNRTYAAPIFRKHGAPYTIFFTPGFVERNRTMWWETAEALTRSASSFRFDFGAGIETVKSVTRAEKWLAFERLSAFVQLADEDNAVAAIDRAAQECGVSGRQIVDDEIMTASELGELVAGDPGVRLGAHTLTHCNLKRVGMDRLRDELKRSAIRVGIYSGRVPAEFAYPYGGRHAVGLREAGVARGSGFAVAVTTQPGVLSAVSINQPMLLPRVSLNGLFQKKRYVRALLSGLPFRLI